MNVWVPEVVFVLLDACVEGAAVAPEGDGEGEVVLHWVPQQERALRLPTQQLLRLVSVHLAPVETTKHPQPTN